MPEAHAEHFDSVETQAHAATLGMWVFLCSEILLFGGLFALFAAYRTEHPDGFHDGMVHAARNLGSLNTAVLLVSSTLAALGVESLRAGRTALARALVLATAGLGLVFLVIKLSEYGEHLREGIGPDGRGPYFVEHAASRMYWTLYYVMTGLHAVHVTVGVGLLTWAALRIQRGALGSNRLAVVVLYWHLVDVVWIFLWPLFYLA